MSEHRESCLGERPVQGVTRICIKPSHYKWQCRQDFLSSLVFFCNRSRFAGEVFDYPALNPSVFAYFRSCPFSFFCFPCSIPRVNVRTTVALETANLAVPARFSVSRFLSSVPRFLFSALGFSWGFVASQDRRVRVGFE